MWPAPKAAKPKGMCYRVENGWREADEKNASLFRTLESVFDCVHTIQVAVFAQPWT